MTLGSRSGNFPRMAVREKYVSTKRRRARSHEKDHAISLPDQTSTARSHSA